MEAQTESTQQNSIAALAPRVTTGWCAETIRIARKARSLTQEELASALGCRQQTISEWELGMYAPKNAYQKLLNQYFAKEGGESHEATMAPSPVIALTPAAGQSKSFRVTIDELEGTIRYMRANGLGEMQIALHHAQDTFRIFGLAESPAPPREQILNS